MLELLKSIDAFAWGPPLLILLVGTGIYLTVRLGLCRFCVCPRPSSLFLPRIRDMVMYPVLRPCVQHSQRQLVREILLGVATAIKVGGPGALFWMWMAAFFGMATKYAEGLLAIKYRTKDDNGAVAGGPMHYILLGMGESGDHLPSFLLSQVF